MCRMLCRMLLKDMAELIFWLTMLGFNVLAHLLRSLYQLRKTLSIPMFLVTFFSSSNPTLVYFIDLCSF
ncbi:hypothetical protein NC653_013284 [Populus alba x Populus x berolinensis]|uniref:Uncharacterized protein n=1 Tax=Populus alba x Populus x berolinensis TaxID=444605 RepID=A0AAD6W2C3_9ROSI|nr:hypothetical protein NC653_013284 [Populus alba x Populus x berolinensis]